MRIDEFMPLGCLSCGFRNFESTGPIEADGPTEITCDTCGRVYEREEIASIEDSIAHEELRKSETGEEFVEPRMTRYENEEQFIDKFVENVEAQAEELEK